MVLMEKSYKNHGTVTTRHPQSSALASSSAATGAEATACPLRIVVASRPDSPQRLRDDVLACIRYGDAGAVADPRAIPLPLTRLDPLAGEEYWLSTTPVSCGVMDGIRHACNDEVLFAWLHVEEADLRDMELAVRRAYLSLNAALGRLGFPHRLRVWNYLAHINKGEGDQERYRLFSLGRHHALATRPGFEDELPAATGIGTNASGLTICVLAARHAGRQVENPRQVSAFRYPRQYGPRSPSFSRATLRRWQDRSLLFVSGTASVVGHASLHRGKPLDQLEETLRNIDALVAHAAERNFPDVSPGFAPVLFKLYVRTPELFEAVRDAVERRLQRQAPTIVLQGDICRHDLLLEVEALYAWEHRPGHR